MIKMLYPMQYLPIFILVYTALVCFLIPVCVASEEEKYSQFTDDVILNIFLWASAIMDAVSDIFLYSSPHRKQIRRKHWSVSNIFKELGPYYVRRSYRMSEVHFCNLRDLISPCIIKHKRTSNRRKCGRENAPNGIIHSSVRLSIAIHYFSGANPCNLMSSHGVGYTDVYRSVWSIVDAINRCPYFQISHPTCHQKQKEIASGFRLKSWVGLDNSAGAIDGMLIWTNKPSQKVLEKAKLGPN